MRKSPVNLNDENSQIWVPPTPRPGSANLKEQFCTIMWARCPSGVTATDFLSKFDHSERYSEMTAYSQRPYRSVHCGKLRTYVNALCTLCVEKIDDNGIAQITEEHYVIADRVPSEIERLEQFCPCFTCGASFFNPLKYVWCPMCTRCLKAGEGFADPAYIVQARIASKINKPSSRRLSAKEARIIEATVILLFLILLGWCYW